MKSIKMVVLAVVSVLLAAVLSGCQTKNDKIKEFLYRYGNVTAEEAYAKSGFNLPENELKKLDFKITSVDIKDVKNKKNNEMAYHFVKAKINYALNFRVRGKNSTWIFVRWVQLAIEEDGFGNLLVDMSKSKEIFTMGMDENDMKQMFRDQVESGEKLMM